MKTDPVLQAIAAVAPKRPTLAILNYGLLSDGFIRVTDLDRSLTIRDDRFRSDKSVLFHAHLYAKSGDLQAAINAASGNDIKDFPDPDITKLFNIADQLPADFSDLVPSVNHDKTDFREALHYIYVDAAKKRAVAADGGMMFMKSFASRVKRDFFLDPAALKVVRLFAENPAVSVRKYLVDYEQVVLTSARYTLIYKVPEITLYPKYEKVIPDYTTHAHCIWDEAKKKILYEFIREVQSFLTKNGMIVFGKQDMVCRNRDLNYRVVKQAPFSLFPIDGEWVIGLNALRLKQVLDFFKNEKEIFVSLGKDPKKAVLFEAGERTAVLMPLKINDNPITLEQFLER